MASNKTDWRDALAALAGPEPTAVETPPDEETAPTPTDTLTIFYERKGRGGKQATIIAGFTCSDEQLKTIASQLKQRLGCGGSARGGEILIQGDRRDEARDLLRSMGHKVKG
ncbi:MAG: translation initiation factor [Pseudoflavonifractor sp.]|nr:translation initiation factor [Alloprevotella sp.]MCM1117611.1 translation initiation factor [Pseudoflavonifractor sp.]